VAKRHLAEARSGLRLLELIALIAPLLGLLGTVLGMIDAFRELQAAGGAADPLGPRRRDLGSAADHGCRHGRRDPGGRGADLVRERGRPVAA
jgi:hypothetical protein